VPPPIPVTVIGGYLGAGKTTLVNHLLQERAGRRIAVLVNDFGDLSIDDDLIEARDAALLRLAGGCVCCSFGHDLMAALQQMRDLRPAPEHILIECSGVAHPAAVARTLTLLPGLTLDAVLVLADAETLRQRCADRYVGELVLQQLREADFVALNKIDLAMPDDVAALQTWLAETAMLSQSWRRFLLLLAPLRAESLHFVGKGFAIVLGGLGADVSARGKHMAVLADLVQRGGFAEAGDILIGL